MEIGMVVAGLSIYSDYLNQFFKVAMLFPQLLFQAIRTGR